MDYVSPGESCHLLGSLCVIRTDDYLQVMVKSLEPVLTMVLSSFQDPHPRVRWAAINAIGQLSTDLGPELQEGYHQLVLPALISAMDDFQNPRVQVRCLTTTVCLVFTPVDLNFSSVRSSPSVTGTSKDLTFY